MHITEVALAAAITVSVAGVSYAAFDTDALTQRAQTVASKVDCRTVDTAIVAYLAENDAVPRRISDIQPYVRGDISAYRIKDGLADGPGCEPVTAR